MLGVGDFDGDCNADILWRNSVTGETGEYLSTKGSGSASYLKLGTVSSEWQVAGTGDYDGDGKADVLWTNTQTGETGAWESSHGSGPSSFVHMATLGSAWQVLGITA